MCRLAHAYHITIAVLSVALILAVAFAGVETWLRHVEHEKWLDYLNEYDFADYEYTQDGEGLNIIGDGNGVTGYVATLARENSQEEEPGYSQRHSAAKTQKTEIDREDEPEDKVQ
jgi:hypothetical protein